MSFAVWLTGLSGSGKSAIARELAARLHARGVDAAVLESDVLRTQLTPYASYAPEERDFFYAALAQLGASVVAAGRPVVFDATANLRAYRDAARAKIARFAEVFVDTPLEVCAARDTKGLYRAAREGRSATLPGAQAAYEPPAAPEVVVHGDRGTPAQSAAAIAAWLEERGWLASRASGLDGDQAAAPESREHGPKEARRMTVKNSMPQVGAPDPEAKNSPIVDHSEYDDRDAMFDVELEAGACYFNGQAFAIGDTVRSGSDVLECVPRGVWVRKGVKRELG